MRSIEKASVRFRRAATRCRDSARVAPGIFLRQHRFADAAKAVNRRRLRDGERGGPALPPEGAVDVLEKVHAPGKAGHGADFGV